jgi:hypothetical protein
MRSKLTAACLFLAMVALMTSGVHARVPVGSGLPAPTFERAILKLSRAQDHTVPAVPAHLPAPAMSAGIGPGSHLLMVFASDPGTLWACTANFIWKPPTGTKRYLGAAGHCFVPEGKTATHGPGADYNASGTSVRVCVSGCSFGGETGFIFQGTTVSLGPVVYGRQTQFDSDIGNDFGLVEIPTAHLGSIRTSMPVWGGPASPGSVSTGGLLCLYGNGVAVGEAWPTMARAGIGISDDGSSWEADLPSMVGDSGSAVETCGQDADGLHGKAAAGILTHLAPGFGLIAGTSLAKAITMATQAGLTISLVPGA